MNNLDIYNAGRVVPAEAQKQFNNGRFSGTDINPMWRIKKLTETFGPCGLGWYVGDVVEHYEDHGEQTIAIVNLNLYVNYEGEWSKPIYGTGGNVVVRKGQVSDEAYKMAYTDALSVACKALGIGADVYFSKDATKYSAADAANGEEARQQRAASKPAADAEKVAKMRGEIAAMLNEICGEDEEKLKACYIALTKNTKAGYAGVDSLDAIADVAIPAVHTKLKKQYTDRKKGEQK